MNLFKILRDWRKRRNWQVELSNKQLGIIERNARREAVYLHYATLEQIAKYNYREAKALHGENSKECQEAKEQWRKALHDYATAMLNKA